jgi:hypothetical protein
MRVLNPGARLFEVSCRTGQGLDAWVGWLERRMTVPRTTVKIKRKLWNQARNRARE